MSSAKRSLQELRRLRQEGKTRASTYSVGDSGAIYDELSEEKYREHQRARLLEDDFVVDDNGDGYIDNGAYEWESEQQDLDDDAPRFKRHKSPAASGAGELAGKRDGNLNSIFRKAASSRPQVQRPVVETAALDSLIDGLGSSKKSSARSSAPFRTRPHISGLSTPTPAPRNSAKLRLDAIRPEETSAGEPQVGEVRQEQPPMPRMQPLAPPSSPPATIDPEDQMEMEDLLPAASPEPPVTIDSEKSLPTPAQSSDNEPGYVHENFEQNLVDIDSSTSPEKLESSRFLSGSDSLSFFWTDYSENGTVLMLYGRTGAETGNASVCVVLQGLYREIYFLPKPEKTCMDVHAEVEKKLFALGVKEVMARPLERKYCFGEEGIPAEAEYLMVRVPVDISTQQLATLSGDTFSHVFGTQVSLFERFVLACNVMGPCWLNVKNLKLAGPSTTSCQLTVVADGTKNVSVDKLGESDMPPMNLMSMSLRTIMNKKTKKQEVVSITARFFQKTACDSLGTASELPSCLITGIRPTEQVYPIHFNSKLEEAQKKAHVKTITVHKTEKGLLSWFMSQVHRFDPDFIIGHQLENIHLSVLINRLKELDVHNWYYLGRKTSKARQPLKVDAYSLRQWTPGRLLCDLSNDMAKSMTPKCDSWSLGEMTDIYLGRTRLDFDLDISRTPWISQGADGLISMMRHNEQDTLLIADLALKIQILALSKQLTCLAGNSWARTLSGSRVDRNEYILLHEFTRQGYLVPEKSRAKNHSGKAKAKYTGGLVFEPEKGLYRTNVLVMDFNSLYPSIIQEFNICFTTIDQAGCTSADSAVPQLPGRDVEMGIFPKLIQNLVQRRREVKSLMKSPTTTEAQRAQYDIRQQALKLTANSMYGCLGFPQSRFYALPLAMLTTAKGREILEQTKHLAEQNSLRVVYGDTDSVMIDTNVVSYTESVAIGHQFKKKVNDQYRMLEIDIDNVFGALLLNAKKKYAAINVTESQGVRDAPLEVKGLDLKRREYCQLSKEASLQALEYILRSDDIDMSLENLHSYLRDLGEKVRKNEIGIGKYIIRNKLGKDPRNYPEAEQKKLPHVTVALRQLEAGDIVKADDVMSFIITNKKDAATPAERARTVPEMKREKLSPDFEYYLVQQVLPPLERICANVEGTDRVRLAECLGINVSKHNIRLNVTTQATHSLLMPFETTIPDKERYKDCHRLTLQCNCNGGKFEFQGLEDPTLTPQGIQCPTCKRPFGGLRLHAQLEAEVRKQIMQYYNGWLQCDDALCRAKTRKISVYGKKCIANDGHCRGTMSYVYSDKDLFAQLSYYRHIFGMDKSKSDLKFSVLADQNHDRFKTAREIVDRYLDNCGRRFVDMKSIFRFA